MPNYEGNRGTKTILGNREHKKTYFGFLGNGGTSQLISGEQWNIFALPLPLRSPSPSPPPPPPPPTFVNSLGSPVSALSVVNKPVIQKWGRGEANGCKLGNI